MRLSIKAFYISMAISQIVFLITCLETQADTRLVKNIAALGSSSPRDLTDVDGTLFFSADDGVHGRELWKSDGTEDGTVMVKDINPLIGSDPRHLTNVNGTLFFSAGAEAYLGDILIHELWKSDGTKDGTVMVRDLNAGNPGNPQSLTNVNGTLFFSAYDYGDNELWKSDGTEAGTVMVKDINPQAGFSSFPGFLTNFNGTLYFAANDGANGRELWKSNGTAAGTIMVKDIDIRGYPLGSSSPQRLTPIGNFLFFTADDGEHGRELWKCNGTEAGTVMVEDIWGLESGSEPKGMTRLDLIVAFSADDGLAGRELWGSRLGLDAYPIKDIRTLPGNAQLSSDPEFFTALGSNVFFAATAADGTARELWKSDGTEAGTVIVKNINPLADSSPSNLTIVNGRLYFAADDGANGRELWRSNGTSAGTFMVKNIHPSAGTGSSPSSLINVKDTLFFAASDGSHGRELWISNADETNFPWEMFFPAFIKK